VHYDPQATQTVKQYIDALNKHLLRTHQLGRSTVVIIDEAQNLSPAVLEQVRLLTNLETDEKKLMRIILVGQPELSELLARQELRQLAQRITARYHLGSLSREDCSAYVAHRLSRAGGHPQLFTNAALRRLYRLSKGTPRIINVIADRALLGAYAQDAQRVNARTVARAAREVLGQKASYPIWLTAAVGLVALTIVGWLYFQPQFPAGTTASSRENTSSSSSAAAARTSAAAARTSAAASHKSAAGMETTVVDEQPAAAGKRLQQIDNELRATATNAAAAESQEPSPISGSQSPSGALAAPATTEVPAAATTRSQSAPIGGTAEAVVQTAAPPTGTATRPPGNIYELQRQAYAAVFERWGADYLESADSMIPCDFAPIAGLQCLSQYGSWSNIEQTDLPVVLELWDEQAAPYHAALTHMDGAEVTLSIGEDRIRTTLQSLRDVWFGAYVVLWQTPPGYRGSLRQGDTHATVGWLRQQLSGISAAPLNSGEPNYFDARLHDAIVDFQRQEGLIIDGVVGPATWIRLSTRLRLPAPRLSS
jgi:general secretion pathway protein A